MCSPRPATAPRSIWPCSRAGCVSAMPWPWPTAYPWRLCEPDHRALGALAGESPAGAPPDPPSRRGHRGRLHDGRDRLSDQPVAALRPAYRPARGGLFACPGGPARCRSPPSPLARGRPPGATRPARAHPNRPGPPTPTRERTSMSDGTPDTTKFNPAPYIINLGRGRGEYLEVKFRLLWLRTEHPDAHIVTEMLKLDKDVAVFRASVALPNGGSAVGHGSESPGDFRDYVEKAETKALGRALAHCGFGTQFVGDEMTEGDRIVDAPVKTLPEGREGLPRTYAPPPGTEGSTPLTDVPHRPPTAAMPHAQPPTERMVKFARALQREVELTDEEFDAWCAELFNGRAFGELNMPQVSTLITALQRRKAERS